jgi:hypothetical protein
LAASRTPPSSRVRSPTNFRSNPRLFQQCRSALKSRIDLPVFFGPDLT